MIAAVFAVADAPAVAAGRGAPQRHTERFDANLRAVLDSSTPESQRVIIRVRPGSRLALKNSLTAHGDRILGEHESIDALTAVVHGEDLAALADNDEILSVSSDAIVRPHGLLGGLLGGVVNVLGGAVNTLLKVVNGLLSVVVAVVLPGGGEVYGPIVAPAVLRQSLGVDNTSLTGRGVGVAVIDSGLESSSEFSGRVAAFYDFTTGGTVARSTYTDDYGHGTHVAGTIGGSGALSNNYAYRGLAPKVKFVILKVLDKNGAGYTSDVIRAIDFAVANRSSLGIDIINLSLGHPIFEPAASDPLVQAVERASKAGVVVVAAAGNYGKNLTTGLPGYAGITSPGNAPWVLTVGASSHMGTIDRADDTIAAFSSRGPSAVDYRAKPDLVAPGVGIESLSDPNSAFYTTKASYLLSGTVPTSYLPYLSLTGTSMSTPVVSGTIALMLQANPALTPNQIKAILQYTAQPYPGYDRLTEGAGFLNAKGAVELACFLAAPSSNAYPASADWGAQLIWGNHLFQGGRLTTAANAWPTSVTWGEPTTSTGQTVEWGLICSDASCANGAGTWSPWGTTGSSQNVVWGTRCGGADCQPLVSAGGASVYAATGNAVVSGTSAGDGVVWGTTGANGDGVVWGTSGADGDGVVWGTSCTDPSCEPVIWPPQ